MNLICTAPLHDPRWQTLVNRLGNTVFHSQEWMRVLEKTYGFDVQGYLLLDEHDQPTAGVPFCRIKDLKPDRMVSLPFCDYLDPLIDSPASWQILVDQLLSKDCTYAIRPLHNDIALTDERLALVKRAKWHGRSLCDDEETIWQSLHGSARRAIRKAQNGPVEVQTAGSKADLRAFYELHLNIRKNKYRMVAQPYAFFENIWDQFIEEGQGKLLIARVQGEVVAGVLLLVWKDKLFYKFNASSPDHLDARPNDLLLWEAIRYGKACGLTYFDFGLSDWDQEGLIRYKRKFATDEGTISFLQYKPVATEPDQIDELTPLLHQLTGLFTDDATPISVCEAAGELLYRYFT